MKKITALFALSSALLMFSCDTTPAEGGEGPAAGKYLPVPEADHVSIKSNNPSGTFSGGQSYGDFAESISGQFADGTIEKLELNGDGSWSIKLDVAAFIPNAALPTKSAARNYLEIPGQYQIPSPGPTYSEVNGLLMLSVPRAAGEEILKDMLPEDYHFIFDNSNKDLILERFNKGVFRVTAGAISLNFKYREESGLTYIYIDKQMLDGTLSVIAGLLDLIENPTSQINDVIAYVNEYRDFLVSCSVFEVGTCFSLQ